MQIKFKLKEDGKTNTPLPNIEETGDDVVIIFNHNQISKDGKHINSKQITADNPLALFKDVHFQDILSKYRKDIKKLYLPSVNLLSEAAKTLLGEQNKSITQIVIGKVPEQKRSLTKKAETPKLQECELKHIADFMEALEKDNTLEDIKLNVTFKTEESQEIWNKIDGITQKNSKIRLETSAIRIASSIATVNNRIKSPIRTSNNNAHSEIAGVLAIEMIALAKKDYIVLDVDTFDTSTLKNILTNFKQTQGSNNKLRITYRENAGSILGNNWNQDIITKVFEGLKSATQFTEIKCTEQFYPKNENEAKAFYEGFSLLTHLRVLTIDNMGEYHAALLDFVKKATHLEVLTIEGTVPSELKEALQEAVNQNGKIMIKFDNMVIKVQTPEINAPVETVDIPIEPTHDATITPITPIINTPAKPVDSPMEQTNEATTPLAPTVINTPIEPIDTTTKPLEDKTTASIRQTDHIRIFINRLFQIDPKEVKGKFSYRVLEKGKGLKEQIADKLHAKISGNKDLNQLLSHTEQAEKMAYKITCDLSHVKLDGAKLHNVGLWNGASFVNAIASFFYSLMQVRVDYGKSLYDWTFNHPTLTLENPEKLVEVLTSSDAKAEGINRYKIDDLINKTAEKLGLTIRSPALAQ